MTVGDDRRASIVGDEFSSGGRVKMMRTTAANVSREISPTGQASARILKGRDLLCFSHDWSGDPLSKTHLMRLLSRDNRILWVNSIGYRAPSASARDFRRALE